MTQPLKPTIRNGETEVSKTAVFRGIEVNGVTSYAPRVTVNGVAYDRVDGPKEPTAFNWTPAMSAIWPAEMRPTMSGLLAIWEAMQEAAVYGEASSSKALPEADADGWIEWGGGKIPVALGLDTPVIVKFRDGGISEQHLSGFWYSKFKDGNNWFHENRNIDIIAYRVLP